MSSHKVTAPAPAQVTTTIQPIRTELKDSLFSAADIYFVLAVCVALTIVVGFFLNRSSTKRKEDRELSDKRRTEEKEDAAERTQKLMDAIQSSKENAARDVRELSEKVRDGKTVLDKEIEQIRSVVRHDIAAVKTQIQSVNHFGEKSADEIIKLRDRMTAQETNSKHQTDALNKLEVTVREKIEEMKDLIKSQGETSTAQFRELSASLREARDSRIK